MKNIKVKASHTVEMIRVEDVDVGNRYREDFGNIEELMSSIKEKGIIQPITVTEIEGAKKGEKKYKLLAGERRWTSCFNLAILEIPALIRESEDELDAREIELMENIHRKEFTWQERAKLTARIHQLYKEKDPGWTGSKTAELIDASEMSVSRALKLDAAIKVLPTIEACKTADEATKVLKKAEENAIVAELAKRQQTLILTTEQNPKALPKDKGIATMLRIADSNYVIGDTFEHMKGMKTNGHVDFIECDPPYAVELAQLTKREGQEVINKRDEEYHEISEEEYPEFLKNLCEETFRIAGRDCWMVLWFAFKWMGTVRQALIDAGWTIDEVPALWLKGNGRTPRPDLLLARSYEPFFIARKGQPTIIKQGRMNAWTRNADEKKYHPAQRPVGLISDILETFLEGMKNIVVPFAGSGATLRAAYRLGHKVIGFDSNKEYKSHFLLAVEEDTKKLLDNK